MKGIEEKSQILDKENGLKCEKYSATNALYFTGVFTLSVTGDQNTSFVQTHFLKVKLVDTRAYTE